MNYKKLLNNLKNESLIDNRNLFCYSNANVTRTNDYFIYTKFINETQENLPRFMILSLKNDKLHISEAKLMGGFKKYFATLELSKLAFISFYSKDFIDTYEFNYDLGENKKMLFKINSSYKRNLTRVLIEAIKKFNNVNTESSFMDTFK